MCLKISEFDFYIFSETDQIVIITYLIIAWCFLSNYIDTTPNTYSISGSGINSTLAAGITVEVIVKVTDSSGSIVSNPTEEFYLKVSNRWSSSFSYYCKPTSTSQPPLTSSINTIMRKNSNGTYSSTFTVPSAGKPHLLISRRHISASLLAHSGFSVSI